MNVLLSRNVHPAERAARLLAGTGLLSLAFVGPQTPLGYAGLIFIVTGLVGSCPLYSLFGFSTCPLKSR